MRRRVGEVAFVAALGLALLGVVLLAVGARGSWPAGIGGGVMLGAAAAFAMLAMRMQPLGAQSPAVALLLGALLGVAAGFAGRDATR
jgi:hypothetical protein